MFDPTLHLQTFARRWERLRPPTAIALLPESPAARMWSEVERLRPALLEQLERHRETLAERIVAVAEHRAALHDDPEGLLQLSTLWVVTRDVWDVLLAPQRDHVTQLVAASRGRTRGLVVDESLACSVVEETLSALERSRRSRIWQAGAPLRGRSNFELQNIHALVQQTARYRLRDRRIESLDDPDALQRQGPAGLREARHRQARQIARLALTWSAAAARTRPRGRSREDAVVSVLVKPEGPSGHAEEQARSRIRMDAQVRAAIIYEQWTKPGDWARSVPLLLAEPDQELAGAEERTRDLLDEAASSWLDLMGAGLHDALVDAVAGTVQDGGASDAPGLHAVIVNGHQYYSATEPRRGAQLSAYIEAARAVGAALRFHWSPEPPPSGEDRDGRGASVASGGRSLVGGRRRRNTQRARLWRLVLQVIEQGEASIDTEPELDDVIDELGGPPPVEIAVPAPGRGTRNGAILALAAALLLGVGVAVYRTLPGSGDDSSLLAPQPVPWVAWPSVVVDGVPQPWPDGGGGLELGGAPTTLDVLVDREDGVGALRVVGFFVARGQAALVYDATIPAGQRGDPAPRRRALPRADGQLLVVVAPDVDGLLGRALSEGELQDWLRDHERSWSAVVDVERR